MHDLMEQCKSVCSKFEQPLQIHMSDTVPMVPMVQINRVNQTRPLLIELLHTVGDIERYKSNITLTITLTSYHIVSRPLSDTQMSRIECTELVVDKFFPGLLSSAATLLPDQNTPLHKEITPVPGLFEDPATIDLPTLLSSHTKTKVVEVSEVSDELPARCREVGNVLGCLLLQSGEDPTSYRFEPFDLSHWPVAVKFADEWVHEKPAAWWQRIVPSVRKVWVLTESSPECRQGEAIRQVYGTCWMVSVLNLFARVPFLFLMLHEDLQKVVLACDGMHSDGKNILRKSVSTRQQQECPKLPRHFHEYMENRHESWYDVTLDSGWWSKKLIRGMFEFSGNEYDEQNKTITSLLTTIEYKEVVGVEKEREEEAGWEPQDGFLAWLTAQCQGYEAGLFSFQKQHKKAGHVVALTMCRTGVGQIIVCDYGVCVSIADWLEKQGLTVVLRARLILYRQAVGSSRVAATHHPSGHTLTVRQACPCAHSLLY